MCVCGLCLNGPSKVVKLAGNRFDSYAPFSLGVLRGSLRPRLLLSGTSCVHIL